MFCLWSSRTFLTPSSHVCFEDVHWPCRDQMRYQSSRVLPSNNPCSSLMEKTIAPSQLEIQFQDDVDVHPGKRIVLALILPSDLDPESGIQMQIASTCIECSASEDGAWQKAHLFCPYQLKVLSCLFSSVFVKYWKI